MLKESGVLLVFEACFGFGLFVMVPTHGFQVVGGVGGAAEADGDDVVNLQGAEAVLAGTDAAAVALAD